MEHNRPDNELVSAYSLAEKPAIELETVQKAMQGDKEAFSALFMQTYRTMFLVVRRFLARDEDIYDALQNGYTKAYKYLPRLQAPEAFLTWLKRTMENAARDIRADLTGWETAQEDMAGFADELTADDTESSERRADIQEVLDRLEPRQAEVLTLYYYDGMKLSEIARLLGEPQSTVRSRFAQAKKALVEQLKVKGIDKSLYSGSVSAMIAVCLRSLIGTDVLSAATAQQMLDDIVSGQQGRLGAAAYKLLEARRNRAILKAVSLLMALTVAVSCVTVALLNVFPWKRFSTLPAAGQPDISDNSEWSASSASGSTDREGATTGHTAAASVSGGTTEAGQPASDASASSNASPTETVSTGTGSTGDAPSSPATTTATEPSAAFVPDYRPGKANTEMRNPAWRVVLYNSGLEYLDWQDEWVYCFKGVSGGYKFRRDGTGEKTRIQAPGDGMVAPMVWGDWIYYVRDGHKALKRVRTDGAIVEMLVEVSGRQEIHGFTVQGDQLIYAVCQNDSFGVPHYTYRSYSLATGEDQSLSLNGDFGFYGYVPKGDWFFNVYGFYAVSFGRDRVDFLEQISSEAAYKWHKIRDIFNGFPVYILGDKLYTPTGHCIDFSGDTPRVYRAVSFSGSSIKEGTVFQVEFVDEASGRLAVTLYDESGIYPESMRWYSEKEGWGSELPDVLLRNTKYQTYQTSGDGYVFTTKEDGTWFSCKMDGSDYIEYIF